MKSVTLGNTDIRISPVGLGCMGFTHAYGEPMDEMEAARLIREAHEMGYTLFDTAQRYTGIRADGTTAYNEDVVGLALEPIRDEVVIATKCGISIVDGERTPDARPETIRRSIDESLTRLRTDHVDLYYLHTIDPATPIETVAETMAELKAAGKILAWGISQCDEDTLRRAHAVLPVSAVQLRYSMMARDEARIFGACRELGVTFVAFSPMANGFLTGAYTKAASYSLDKGDFRAMMPQFTEEGIKANQELLAYVGRLAEERGATMAQMSLAWMESRPECDIVPIPGSTDPKYLKENFDSCRVELTADEVHAIDAMLDKVANGPVFGGASK